MRERHKRVMSTLREQLVLNPNLNRLDDHGLGAFLVVHSYFVLDRLVRVDIENIYRSTDHIKEL